MKSKILSRIWTQLDNSISYNDKAVILLCRGVRPTPNECSGYDTKQSDGEVPVMLKLWGMWSIPSLPLLPGPQLPGVVGSDRVLSIDQIELNCILMLNWLVWNRTVYMYKNGFDIITYNDVPSNQTKSNFWTIVFIFVVWSSEMKYFHYFIYNSHRLCLVYSKHQMGIH